jgi:hypothetical protein
LGAALGTGISMALLHLLEAWLVRELFLKINIIYILKIGGGVASGLWLSSFIGGAYLPSLLGRGFFYLAYLLVFFLLTKPLTALDLQHLNNLRPGAARFLRFFSLKPV